MKIRVPRSEDKVPFGDAGVFKALVIYNKLRMKINRAKRVYEDIEQVI